MLYASNLFNSLIFANLLFVKLLMFLLKNSFDDKYFLKIMVDNWGFYSKWIEWMGFLSVVWLIRISVRFSQEIMGLMGRFYFEGSEYGFNCLRTDKQSVNIDGLFYITLTVAVILLHQLSLLSLPHHYLCRFQSWLGKFWVDWWGFS